MGLATSLIPDLEAAVECRISKITDDTKLGGAVESQEGQEALPRKEIDWSIGQ